jgi:hypothetical protein
MEQIRPTYKLLSPALIKNILLEDENFDAERKISVNKE